MHDRAKNLCAYLGELYDKYLPVPPPAVEPEVEGEKKEGEKKEEENQEEGEDPKKVPPKSDIELLGIAIKTYFDDEKVFKNFQFGYLGLLCNNETARPKIQKLREMDKDPEYRKLQIAGLRDKTRKAKELLEKLEATPDEELDKVIVKLSLYINLFTKIYFE